MTARRPARRRGGFTLVESIAAIVVLGALGSIASFLIVDSVDGYVAAAGAAQLHAELSVALDRAAREIRRIGPDPAAAGPAPDIEGVTSTSISWNDAEGDDCELALSGSTVLLRVDGGAPAVLLADVTAFAVTVYDGNDAPLGPELSGAGCDAIRRVRLEATLERENVTQALRAKVFIRSMMSGA